LGAISRALGAYFARFVHVVCGGFSPI